MPDENVYTCTAKVRHDSGGKHSPAQVFEVMLLMVMISQ